VGTEKVECHHIDCQLALGVEAREPLTNS
jgi:hypothetical protein